MAKIAIPLGEDFEDAEFTVPQEHFIDEGHEVTVFGASKGRVVVGKRGAAEVVLDDEAGKLDPDHFDALVIPGGYSPDKLRLEKDVVDFVKRFVNTGKPVAAICHGPQLLIEADAVRGRTLTSWPSVRKDLENAGAHWVDEEVCIDNNLITSRKPEDLEAFSDAILHVLRDRSAAIRRAQ